MKITAIVCLAAVYCIPSLPDVKVFAMHEPSFGNDIFIVVERTGDDAKAIWDVDDETLEEVRSDTGEVLQPSPFGMKFVSPGYKDPTRKGFEHLEEGRSLLVFRFRGAQKPVKSIARFAGTYELLSGGAERWIDVPFAKVADEQAWKDEALEAAGFKFTQGVREVQQLHLKVSGETFDVSSVGVRLDGADEDLPQGNSSSDLNSITYEFDISDADVSKLTARVELDDGTLVEIGKLTAKSKFTKLKSAKLAKADISLQVRVVAVREFFAKGTGDFDCLRGYRWVDKKGKDTGIHPHSQASGGRQNVSTSCRVPAELKRGVRLQMGVISGAKRETHSFEYTKIKGPGK